MIQDWKPQQYAIPDVRVVDKNGRDITEQFRERFGPKDDRPKTPEAGKKNAKS